MTACPLSLVVTPFNAFANEADPDQAVLALYGNMIYQSDPTQVDLISNFFVLCTNMQVPSMNIHEGKGLMTSVKLQVTASPKLETTKILNPNHKNS